MTPFAMIGWPEAGEAPCAPGPGECSLCGEWVRRDDDETETYPAPVSVWVEALCERANCCPACAEENESANERHAAREDYADRLAAQEERDDA